MCNCYGLLGWPLHVERGVQQPLNSVWPVEALASEVSKPSGCSACEQLQQNNPKCVDVSFFAGPLSGWSVWAGCLHVKVTLIRCKSLL